VAIFGESEESGFGSAKWLKEEEAKKHGSSSSNIFNVGEMKAAAGENGHHLEGGSGNSISIA